MLAAQMSPPVLCAPDRKLREHSISSSLTRRGEGVLRIDNPAIGAMAQRRGKTRLGKENRDLSRGIRNLSDEGCSRLEDDHVSGIAAAWPSSPPGSGVPFGLFATGSDSCASGLLCLGSLRIRK